MNIHIGPSSYYEYSYAIAILTMPRYTLGRIVCMVFRSCLWCNGLELVLQLGLGLGLGTGNGYFNPFFFSLKVTNTFVSWAI